jgi:YVTN family beta-propeller protein
MVYTANQDSNSVSVMSGATNKVIPTVGVGVYPIALAVNSVTNTIYVTNNGDNTVSVINGATNVNVVTVNVGPLPQAVAVNSKANTIYVANGDGTQSTGSMSVING